MIVQSEELGFRVAHSTPESDDDEDWEDVLDDMEDIWMREPACAPPFPANLMLDNV